MTRIFLLEFLEVICFLDRIITAITWNEAKNTSLLLQQPQPLGYVQIYFILVNRNILEISH